YGIAFAVGDDTVRADFIRRGRSGCGPTLSLLYIPRESGCSRYGDGQADLEKLCHRRNSEAHPSGSARRAVLGAFRSGNLVSSDWRDVPLLAQKSGVVYALDPDRRGKLLWQNRIGHGGLLGGIQWGGAADSHNAYFTLSDYSDTDPLLGGGLFALDLRTGKKVWYAAPPKPACVKEYGCSAAQMAPPTVIAGVVFAGSLDGHLRAYDSRNGAVLWDFDTDREFATTNGLKAH